MNKQSIRWLSIGMVLAILLGCLPAMSVLGTTDVISAHGELSPSYPNLLLGSNDTERDKIWSKITVENSPAAQSMVLPAGASSQRFNLLFMQTNTTYVLSGRVKGGKPDLYFEPNRIQHVNSSSTGWKYPKASETEWTPFSYIFTTGDSLPSGGHLYWLAFGNNKGATTAYFDSLSIQTVSLVEVGISDFKWNNGTNPQIAKPGDVIQQFAVTLTNNGSVDIPAGEGVVVDVCIDATTVVATLPWYRGLAVGESVTLTENTSRWVATEGDHALTAFARTGAELHTYEKSQETEDNQLFYNLRVSNTSLAVPEHAAEYGFTELTFSDDFNSVSSIDVNATGKAGYKWYVTRPYGEAAQVLDQDFSVENGVLTIHTDKTKWSYSLATIDIKKMVGFAFNKGYLECRIRVPISGEEGWDKDATWADDPDNGTVRNPGIWAYPTDTLWASARGVRNTGSVEMDWMEYHGTKYLATFGTTLHERRSEWVETTETNETGETVTKQEWKDTWHTTSGYNSYAEIGSEYAGVSESTAGYHVLSCVWDQGFVRMYVDNELQYTIGYRQDDYPSDRASTYTQQPTIGSMTGMDTQMLPIVLGASEEFPMEVDYVRIWQQPDGFAPEVVPFTLSEQLVTMSTKEKTYLVATDADGKTVQHLHWQSSNPSVVSVYDDGLLVSVGKGTAVVQATDANGNTQVCTVIVDRYGNLVPEGDFEGRLEHTMFSNLLFDATSKTSIGTLVTQSGNTCMQIPSRTAEYFQFLNGVPLRAGKTYCFTFRYKGQPSMRIYDQNGYIVDTAYDSAGAYGLKLKLPASSTWTTVSKMFQVEETVSNPGNLASATLGFANTSGSTAYIDDISVVEVMPSSTVSVGTMTGGSVSVSKKVGITPGEKLTVTVTPLTGYLLQAGSLTYTTQDGNTYPILNSSSMNGLYAGTGQTFTFTAPVGATTIQAVFVSAGENNYQFATVGTSVRRENGSITGVRFLNRLYIDGLDLSGDNLYVVHNKQRKMVSKIGVLMAAGEVDTLTLADYEAYRNGTGDQRVWHAVTYGGPSASLYVAAYTDTYLDCQISMTFAQAMTTTFLNRMYTVCAYMELEDGTVIYTDASSDSVVDALTREGATL